MKMRPHKSFKAQSAMEYLMTYGWAILIIAVVLGALFSLGVFGSGNLLGTACIAQSGYLCSSPTMTTAGLLSFTYGQNTGATQYNVLLNCAGTQASTGGPLNTTYTAALTGAGWDGGMTGNTLVTNGAQISIPGLQCSSTTGIPFSGTIGQTYTGTLWEEYATSSTAAPSIIVQLGTISVKLS